jgi:hypothetical protein
MQIGKDKAVTIEYKMIDAAIRRVDLIIEELNRVPGKNAG